LVEKKTNMKNLKTIAILILLTAFVAATNSCKVVKKDNGKHKGWYKNPKNPHNPKTTNAKPASSKSASPAKAKVNKK
jgi:hypothetical protein